MGTTDPGHEMSCPLCGARLERVDDGVVSELVFTREHKLKRKARPAVFYACMRCEHCHEHGVDPNTTILLD